MRRWFKAPVTLVPLVQDPLHPLCFHSNIKYCFLYFEHLHMVSFTIIHAIEHLTYRQDGGVERGTCLTYQSVRLCWFKTYSYHFVEIPKEGIVSIILNTCTWCHLPLSMLLTSKQTGRMAEWYEALLSMHQSLRWCGFQSNSWHFVDIPIQSIVSLILKTCP